MDHDLISVIVPVYNGEKYLRKCLQSIINQTYSNIEIIIVNDGSVDDTEKICNEFCIIDKRIRVINQVNSGVTNARKNGLLHAKGEYIGFVDADDWIEKDMYECLYLQAKLTKSQVVCSGLYFEFENNSIEEYDKIPEGVYEVNDYILNNMLLYEDTDEEGIFRVNWSKLFVADLIKYAYNKLDDEIVHGEDALTTWISILHANKISILRKNYYHYRRGISSAASTASEKYFVSVSKLYYILKSELEQLSISEEMKKKADKKLVMDILGGIAGGYKFYQDNAFTTYMFPLETEVRNKKIVLYGAGMVGRSYYRQLCQKGVARENVLWVDINKAIHNEDVHSVEEMKCFDYDLVIIAVLREKMAQEIKGWLVEDGVSDEKIVWKRPIRLSEFICSEM